MGDGLAEAPFTEGGEAENVGCEAIPTDLVELHEVLEWEAAIEAERARRDPGMAPENNEAPGFA
jgi:hypothetical protein